MNSYWYQSRLEKLRKEQNPTRSQEIQLEIPLPLPRRESEEHPEEEPEPSRVIEIQL